uniref:Protein KRI1 homolog n=1 Tax=Panagrellus redivivus TaxID=6233 RepID=A0A7E4ZPT1_PANRE
MPKVKLDLDSDDGNDDITINKEYADRYDKWRSAEVYQKLKAKHGNNAEEDEEEESSSESEADWTPADERDFLRTLGALKSKDPKIYNKEKRFFAKKDLQKAPEDGEAEPAEKKSKKKQKGMTLRDYEVALVERGGKFDDEDVPNAPTEDEGYYERNQRLKDEFKKVLDEDSDDDGGLLKKKVKTAAQKQKEEEDYAEWLKGEGKSLANPDEDIKSLKKVWTQPELSNDEAFLRDYLLNKQYEVDSEEEDPKAAIEEIDHIEEELEQAETFEHKYNFRFEDPDQDFIKQYPRTIKESVRKGNEKRKDTREDRKKRKEEEKKQKQDEVKLLKSLKKKEIEQKLKKLRDIAGNEELPVTVEDLEKEFDPREYDRRMKELFAKEYYDDGTEDDKKPVFSDLSDDDLSDYDNMETRGGGDDEEDEEEVERPKADSARKRKRNSKFNRVIQKEKPLFDPEEKTFEDYFNEYYSLDYEDILADGMRTKFKYRNVVPNDFGLNADEILSHDDRQLNKWVSVKKASQYRTDREEEYDRNVYEKKANDPNLKAKVFAKRDILDEPEPTEDGPTQPTAQPGSKSSAKKAKKQAANANLEPLTNDDATDESKKKNRRKKRNNNFHANKPQNTVNGVSVDRLKAYNVSNKAIKRKIHGGQNEGAKKSKY